MKPGTRCEQIPTELVATLVYNLTRAIQSVDVHVRQTRRGISEIQIGCPTNFAVMGIDAHILEAQRRTFRRNHDAGGALGGLVRAIAAVIRRIMTMGNHVVFIPSETTNRGKSLISWGESEIRSRYSMYEQP